MTSLFGTSDTQAGKEAIETLKEEQENVSCIFLAEYSKMMSGPELYFQYPPPEKTSNVIDCRDRYVSELYSSSSCKSEN